MATHLLRVQTKIDLFQASVAQLRKAWEEERHPRDPHGRFSEAESRLPLSGIVRQAKPKRTRLRKIVRGVLLGIGVTGAVVAVAALGSAALMASVTQAGIERSILSTAARMGFEAARVETRIFAPAMKAAGATIVPTAYLDVKSGKITVSVFGAINHAMQTGALRGGMKSFEKFTGGVLSHEIMHAKLIQYEKDGQELFRGMWQPKWNTGDIRNLTAMRSRDGITPYSKMYWDAFERGAPGTNAWLAMHETLAEMARVHHETGVAPPVSAQWDRLYMEVNRHWRTHHWV